MERRLLTLSFVGLFAVSGFASAAPQMVKFDQTVTIDVQDIALGSLLRFWDQATGLKSSVPPELAGQRVSVRVSRLSIGDAVRKIFEKLPVDYVFIAGQGIIVTSASAANVAAEPALAPHEEAQPMIERERQKPAPAPVQEPQRSVIWTPFGPIGKSANPIVQLPPVPGEPPPPPFFAPPLLPTPPAGAANGPSQNELFRPISIYD